MSNHPGVIVTDEELEKCLDWLRDGAAEIGNAKREAVSASHMLKVTKALVMKKFNELPVNQQEREALISQEYAEALYVDALAAGELEKLRALREAAAAKIEVWRTSSANFRAMKI